LRIGIGRHEIGSDMADFVLDLFSQEEQSQLKDILVQGCKIIEQLSKSNIEHVMKEVNS
jgi:peptidyl-tRNA hydrolase